MEIYRRGLTFVFEDQNKIVKSIKNFNGLSISGLREMAIYSISFHPNIQSAQINIHLGDFYFQFPKAISTLGYFLLHYELTPAEKKNLILGLIKGLNFLHQIHILHRDLTNRNILIYRHEGSLIPKISDFGCICSAGSPWLRIMTKEVYQLNYRAPEVYEGKNYGYPADIWSLGCLILEIFNGKVVYPGNNKEEVYQLILTTRPDFSRLKEDFPDIYCQISSFLNYNPCDRQLFPLTDIDCPPLSFSVSLAIISSLLNFSRQKHISINTVWRTIFCLGNIHHVVTRLIAYTTLLVASKLTDYRPVSILEIAEVLNEDLFFIYKIEIMVSERYCRFLLCPTPLELASLSQFFDLEKGQHLLAKIMTSELIYKYSTMQINKFILANQNLTTCPKYQEILNLL